MTALTIKQEAFCKRYVELGDASAAYREVYAADAMKPATVNRKAKELKENGKIAARIAALQDGHSTRHGITVDALILEIEAARDLALKRANPAAAVSASLAKAKLAGLIIRPRDLPIPIALKGSLTEQGSQVITAMGNGQIPPADAASMLQALAAQARVTEIDELEKRVAALEGKHNGKP